MSSVIDAAVDHRAETVLDGRLQHRLRRGVGRRFGFGAQQHFIALELAALDQGHQTLHMQSDGTAAQGGMQAVDFRADRMLRGRLPRLRRVARRRRGRPVRERASNPPARVRPVLAGDRRRRRAAAC